MVDEQVPNPREALLTRSRAVLGTVGGAPAARELASASSKLDVAPDILSGDMDATRDYVTQRDEQDSFGNLSMPMIQSLQKDPYTAACTLDELESLTEADKAIADFKRDRPMAESLSHNLYGLGVAGAKATLGAISYATEIPFTAMENLARKSKGLPQDAEPPSTGVLRNIYEEMAAMPKDQRSQVLENIYQNEGVIAALKYNLQNPGIQINQALSSLPSALIGAPVGGFAGVAGGGFIANKLGLGVARARILKLAAAEGLASGAGTFTGDIGAESAGEFSQNGGDVEAALGHGLKLASADALVNTMFGTLGGLSTIKGGFGRKVAGALGKTAAQAAGGGFGAMAGNEAVGKATTPTEFWLEATGEAVTVPGDVAFAALATWNEDALAARVQGRIDLALETEGKVKRVLTAINQMEGLNSVPDSLAQLIRNLGEQYGDVPTELSIDANKLVEILGEARVQELRQVSPDLDQQIDEAVATGGTVTLGVDEIYTHVSQPGVEAALAKNFKLDADSMSSAEAQAELESFGQEATNVARQHLADVSRAAEVKTIYQENLDSLNAQGRFGESFNEKKALLVSHFYSVMANRMNTTPAELWAKHKLRHSNASVTAEEAKSLSAGGVDSPEFKAAFEGSKVVTPEGEPLRVYHATDTSTPISEFRTPTYFSDKPSFSESFGKGSVYPSYLVLKNPKMIDGTKEGRHFEWDEEDVARMEGEGYDGVVVTHPAGNVYTAFRPEQIKSVFNLDTPLGQENVNGNGTGREAGRTLAPLAGAPTVEGAAGPDAALVSVAEQYAADNGIPYARQGTYVEVNEDRAKRIADAYDAMEHAPNDPAVAEAYQNLIKQTIAQYKALEAAGYTFFFYDETNDPYEGNPWNAMRDLRANKRMGVFATEAGFGSSDLDVSENPMLGDTGVTWPYGSPNGEKKRVLANDLFRAVHDAFGHGLEGAGFRARGEENAWQAHSRLFTGSAVAAITTETRGQNSWLNYGPHGAKNQTAAVGDTVFADQKTGLMPSWTWSEGRASDQVEDTGPQLSTTPGEKPGEVNVVGVHYSREFHPELSFENYGSGMKGAEAKRIGSQDAEMRRRLYFYVDEGTGIHPEAGVGGVPHMVNLTNVYDAVKDPLNIYTGTDATQRERNVLNAGYRGIYVKDAFGNQGAVVMFGKEGETLKAEQYDYVQRELAPEPTSAIDEVLKTFDEKVRFARGTGEDWSEWTRRFAPEIFGELDAAGAFTSTEPEYKDALIKRVRAASESLGQSGLNAWTEGNPIISDQNFDFVTGQPVVVKTYHGSTRGGVRSTSGRTFTSMDPAVASTYAIDGGKWAGDENVVNPLYVKMKNPMVVDAKGNRWMAVPFEGRDNYQVNTLAGIATQRGYDGLIVMNVEDNVNEEELPPSTVVVALGITGQIKSPFNAGNFDSSKAEILAQQTERRGEFHPPTMTISELEKADLSTFLHEMGHFFFEILATLASDPNAPADVVADANAMLKFIGFNGTAEQWLKEPLGRRREGHEKLAETTEQYFMTGKAPSLELQPLFSTFASWLTRVYRSLVQMLNTNKRAALNPEMAAILDRMLATQEAIDQAAEVRELIPQFASAEEAGMTVEEFAEYQAYGQRTKSDAEETLRARMVRDMRWLALTRSKILRELTKEGQAKRKAIHDDVTAEVNKMRVYRVMEFLKKGTLLDDNGVEVQSPLAMGSTKLDRAAVAAMYNEGQVDLKKFGAGKYGMLAIGGVHPSIVAGHFGYTSADEMIRDILGAEPKGELIAGLTDQRTLAEYGDITSREALQKAADDALANEAHSRMVATELRSLDARVGKVSLVLKAAKYAAMGMLGKKSLRNIRPDQSAASAARARKESKRALGAGKREEAAAAKRNEMLHLEMQKQGLAAKREIELFVRSTAKVFRGKSAEIAKRRDLDMVNATRAILAAYGIGPKGVGASAAQYMVLLDKYDGPRAADIKSMREGLPPVPAKGFQDLTLEEFRAVRDIAMGIYEMAKAEKQVTIDGQILVLDEVGGEIVDAIIARDGAIGPLPGYSSTTSRKDEMKDAALSARSVLRRVESWTDEMGPVFKTYILQPVMEATTRMKVARLGLIEKYLELLKPIEKTLTYTPIAAPELNGFVFTGGKSEVLHALLHSGNKSNLRKLILGRGWGTVDAEGNLDSSNWELFIARLIDEGTLTKTDFDFAQGVWDLLETIKVDAQKAHKSMYGYYFNEITADEMRTPFGTYRGGYVPALADPLASKDIAQKREAEDILHAGNSFMFPSTGKGFTNQRVEFNRPLELDLRVIGQHLDKVARFAHLEPAIRDVGKIINNKRVQRALNGMDGTLISRMLNPWLQRTARQTVGMPGRDPRFDKLANALRNRSGMVIMFANVVNTLQQVTGFSMAALKVPVGALARANIRMLGDRKGMIEFAHGKDPWLKDRANGQLFDMQTQIEKILTNPNVAQQGLEFFKRNAYFMQSAVQNYMDTIIWTAAYDTAVSRGASDKQAVRAAGEAVRLTQGSFTPEDISAFESNIAFVRLFTQFFGYFNMQGNLLYTEATKGLRESGYMEKSKRLAFIWFAGLAIPAFVGTLIAQGPPPDDDEDGALDEWLAMFFSSQGRTLTAMVPVAGVVANTYMNRFDDKLYNDRLSISPALGMIESALAGSAFLTEAAYDVVAGKERADEIKKQNVRDVLTLIGVAIGVPTGAVGRAAGFAMDVESGNKTPDSVLDYAQGYVTGK